MTPETKITKFDPQTLPRWAQNDPAVVAKCGRDLSYRANVCSAKTAQMKKFLKSQVVKQ